jgi:CRP-like cAMP-binding protein
MNNNDAQPGTRGVGLPMIDLPLADRLAILKDNEGWFGQAPAAFQDAVLSRCEWRTVRAGSPVLRAVDEYADLVGIVDGAVEIYSRFGTGENPVLHFGHEGIWVGSGSIMTMGPPRLTVIARVDSLVARLSMRATRELLAARPEWWQCFGNSGFEYGDLAISAYTDSLIRDNERRFACTLLRITGLRPPRRSRPERADAPVTQGELAEMTNVSRTTLLEILRRLEQKGIVQQGYRYIRVLDPAALDQIAHGR